MCIITNKSYHLLFDKPKERKEEWNRKLKIQMTWKVQKYYIGDWKFGIENKEIKNKSYGIFKPDNNNFVYIYLNCSFKIRLFIYLYCFKEQSIQNRILYYYKVLDFIKNISTSNNLFICTGWIWRIFQD